MTNRGTTDPISYALVGTLVVFLTIALLTGCGSTPWLFQPITRISVPVTMDDGKVAYATYSSGKDIEFRADKDGIALNSTADSVVNAQGAAMSSLLAQISAMVQATTAAIQQQRPPTDDAGASRRAALLERLLERLDELDLKAKADGP